MSMKPMAVHKNVYINHLRKHPDELADFFPGVTVPAEEFIAALAADEREWYVGGRFVKSKSDGSPDESEPPTKKS